MGCLRALGCLTLVVLAAAAGWLLRDRLPWPDREVEVVPADRSTVVWEPATPAGAERARATVRRLESRRGPVFVTVGPGDLTAYVFEELSRQLPPSAENVRAAVIDGRLHVRADMRPAELGGAGALGPLGDMLGEREPVEFGGTLEVVRPGLAQYRLATIRVRDLSLPPPLIPRLVQRIDRSSRPEGIAPDALPLEVPPYVADARAAQGRVTLYKSAP